MCTTHCFYILGAWAFPGALSRDYAMVQMIAGTIKNAVKQDMLIKNWEQKKNSGNILTKQERNERANMSSEQRMLEQFKEQMAQNREQSKNTDIANKIMNGDDLTPEEEQYLAQNNPGQLSNYRRAKAERKAYEEKLQKCKTKDEVQRLKSNTMNAYLAELKAAPGQAKSAKAMEILGKVRNVEKAERHFIESGGYAKLPTEADEAIDRAEERSKENEENLEIIKESAEADDAEEKQEAVSEENDDKKTVVSEDIDAEIADSFDEKKKDLKPKKEKDLLEEIEEICRRYIPNTEGNMVKNEQSHKTKPKEIKSGSKIDVAM